MSHTQEPGAYNPKDLASESCPHSSKSPAFITVMSGTAKSD